MFEEAIADDDRAGDLVGVDDAVAAAERSAGGRIVCKVWGTWALSSGCLWERSSSVVGVTAAGSYPCMRATVSDHSHRSPWRCPPTPTDRARVAH
ncbi:hypothetical protein AS032_27210 [Rhodococcus qingshengii]|nr:hypothetical protein AOT96_32020 [Rhodococcus sp. 008]KSU70628.1 hypothetical protein AS032_27210 [Rhodococcus qingshengii]